MDGNALAERFYEIALSHDSSTNLFLGFAGACIALTLLVRVSRRRR